MTKDTPSIQQLVAWQSSLCREILQEYADKLALQSAIAEYAEGKEL